MPSLLQTFRTLLLPLARRREAVILGIFLAAVGLGSLVLALASEVMEGETQALDEAILLALRQPGDHAQPIGPLWLQVALTDVTALGSITVLALVTLATAAYLAMRRRGGQALVAIAAGGGALALNTLLKSVFLRPRPDLVAHGVDVYTSSFPSAHAMVSAATYLTLGALVAKVEADTARKIYLMGLAVGLTLLVGLSRIYLGVHYPSDVLAGWTAGAAWALFCWMVAVLARGRRGD
ncbi:phosphatase PAP2 family protein [Zavarzinia sp. CC-PAN008]|uniref:phosphatase PAP2 family protein n=1 Tax=Zavarzinia sp. CC-PAN008 TaxID=3243332 RepID=UPI003F744FA2